jgi:4-methyl-5(b-hydroxyethyl)-thiazole monophosphate biosynthesis
MKKVAILLAVGFEEIEAVTAIDFLRRAGIEVIVCGVNEEMVIGSHGIAVKADCKIDLLPSDLDGIILPGGMPGALNLSLSNDVSKIVTKMHNDNKLIAAICASPAIVLAVADVLKGKRFTCYPGFEEKVVGADYSTDRVVQDGNLITSRGPGSSAEFSIAIIDYFLGGETANFVKQSTLQNW